MVDQCPISPKGLRSSCIHIRVDKFVNLKFRQMGKHAIVVMFDDLDQTIRELDALLKNEQVRTHLDPRSYSPEIGENSSIDDLLLRLRRQVTVSAKLADACYLGPPANADEAEAVAGTKRILQRLHDKLMPEFIPDQILNKSYQIHFH